MSLSNYTGAGIALRFGELFLKGKNRYIFENILLNNVNRAIGDNKDVTAKLMHGRIFVIGNISADLEGRLANVFGISSLSKVTFCKKDMAEIELAAAQLSKNRPAAAKTFRISARRSDKKFKHTSTDIGTIAGSAVAIKTGLAVDLTNPDYNIGIEVGHEWTFLWDNKRDGAKGLPVGTGGKLLLLLSGGIDSPVAGHMMQRRGVALSAVYFHSPPFTGDKAREKVISLAQKLAERQGELKLITVPFTKIQTICRDIAPASYLVILYRRAMIRISQMIAADLKIPAIVTGESLGQVASQTLSNIVTIEDASDIPILRPLIGFDKSQIIQIAKRIETYDTSILPYDDCCSLFAPKHPETKSIVKKAVHLETKLELEEHLEEAVDKAQTIIAGTKL